MKFIIEHLEPKLYCWCLLEYRHISQFIGKKNLVFTNLKTKEQMLKLKKLGSTSQKKVSDLKLNPKKTCLLDPGAKKTLTPSDVEKFAFFVFGGILGDYPPKKRTKKELSNLKAARRNLGPKQMSTDTAVYVTKQILSGKKLADFNFIDKLTLPLKKNEEVILPFRYLLVKGKPFLPKWFVAFLKRRKSF